MNKTNRSVVIVEIIVFVVAGLLLALYFYADNRLLTMENSENAGTRLEKHIAFISQDDSDLWQAVFESAKESAKSSKAYIEWIGKDAPVTYSLSDCMRIATAAGVDGIILHKSPDEQMTDLINEAAAEEIPVIMALEDDEDSERVSYVGMNSYQMGDHYARQIISCLSPGENSVLVITGSSLAEGGGALMYSQMLQAVEQGKDAGQQAVFEVMEVDTGTSFETEEAIRDIFVSRERLPDIIVCLDLTATECVAQALVDYNEVGNVSVIGFYASDTVEEAITRGIIHSTLGIDAEEIGRICVEALEEHFTLGRVSSYFNIGLSVIDG
ncbi:MAG: substrate-binding domain-containing protein [Lachnospiraceae bacterium]|nr:substrate-binding domain-containing protein [Lachnospiraceae bacterium]